MSNNQYSFCYAKPNLNSTAMHGQSVKPYAAVVAAAGLEHDGRSSSSGSPPSSGSSASLVGYNEVAAPHTVSFRFQPPTYGRAEMSQQHYSYGSPEQSRRPDLSAQSTSTRSSNASRFAGGGTASTAGRTSFQPSRPPSMSRNTQGGSVTSLVGVHESLTVQEMAFRQGQRSSSSDSGDKPANPFAKQFDSLWTAFYKLGREFGGEPAPAPVHESLQNFAWPVLINPYTQSLERPNGTFDPAWTGKMIHHALNCMAELVQVTCRRNTGWEKIVADIPQPAQEALMAFPDLAQRYEQLKRDALEVRAGGRPYGY